MEEREGTFLYSKMIPMELYQSLMHKNYLVVLDDIWTKEAWDCLCDGFPLGNNTESNILLTTRNKNVALHVDSDSHPLDKMLE